MDIVIRRNQEEYYPDREFSKLIGNECGIINEILLYPSTNDDGRLYLTSVLHTNIYHMSNIIYGFNHNASVINNRFVFCAGGKSTILKISLNQACGETIERYCACFPNGLNYSSYDELRRENKSAVVPPMFNKYQYITQNFPYSPFDPKKPIYWRSCFNLISKEEIYYPADLIYLMNVPKSEGIIGYATSSGCAAGRGYMQAIYRGLCECIERDASMRTWYSKIPAKLINVQSSSWLSGTISKYTERPDIEYLFLHFLTDFPIHVIACLIIDNSPRNIGAICGISADLNAENAVYSALTEAIQLESAMKVLKARMKALPEDYMLIRSGLSKVIEYYAKNPLKINDISWLISPASSIPINSLENFDQNGDAGKNIRFLVKALDNKKMALLLCDLTTCDVAETGFRVIAAKVPELIPLSVYPNPPYLGNQRFFDLEYLGIKKRLGYEDMNRMVCPFP